MAVNAIKNPDIIEPCMGKHHGALKISMELTENRFLRRNTNMKPLKLGLTMIAFAMLASTVLAGDGEVSENLQAGDWTIGVHLKAIPDEYQEMAKATHHISVTVMKSDKSHIENGKVTYQFTRRNKAVASGEAKFMGGMNQEGSDHKKKMEGSDHKKKMESGHYGADFTLPGTGEYSLQITVEADGETRKATSKITAP